MHHPSSRRGFTLVEFLVVSVLMFVVVAMLTPAVQQSRAQARQTACQHNMKQIGIAIHNHVDIWEAFPSGWSAVVSTAGNGPRFGWQTLILPFIDHLTLFDEIEESGNKFGFETPLPAADFLDDKTHRKLFQTEIKEYRCPADPTAVTNPMRGNYGTSNYSGSHGDVSLPRWTSGRQTALWPGQIDTPRKANGIFYWNSAVTLFHITDGTANTFLVGERSVTSAAGIWPGAGSNNFENDAVTECSDGSRLNASPRSFSSGHAGGANFLMCDGSVHFISNNIDSQPASAESPGTYQRLANRHDGLTVKDFKSPE